MKVSTKKHNKRVSIELDDFKDIEPDNKSK